jgi:formylglycine-generating enzyme required for sulfatase activity
LHKQNKTVDTVGLAAWGKEKGLDFVQLVVESDCSITIGNSAPVNGREQLAQVVSCGTAKYTGRPTYRTRFVPHSSATLNLGTGLDEMVFIVGGVFQMATNYYVELSNFYIGKYEVTQALWKKVMGTLPSSISGNLLGDDKPVVYVSWNDIVGSGGFLEKLKAQTGKSYRLPTEAEWEYAARGCNGTGCEGFEYSGSNTLSDVGWYPGNCSTFQPVGKKRANRLGTYDMSGNVWEWCGDWYGSYGTSTQSSPAVNPTGPSSGSYRAIRGGSYNSPADESGAAHRFSYPPSGSDYYACGFRLVLSEFR